MGVGLYGGKDFWKRYVFSLEWKSEGVMDDDSGDSEEDEGEEDWMRQGWRSETGSSFQRWGDAYWNERFVVFRKPTKSPNINRTHTEKLINSWKLTNLVFC